MENTNYFTKPVDELTFTDDGMFQAVMHDPEICTEVRMSAPGKRTRYYQSMVDIDSLMKGQDYSELKESYILFICKEDPFKDQTNNYYGLPCYTFKNICQENISVNLDDKTVKVLYNASAYKKETNKRVRDFLKFVYTNETGEDDFSNRLAATVKNLIENDKFRNDYLAMNLHDRDITRAAKKEGAEEKAIENAKALLADGKYTAEEISKLLNIPVELFTK